MSFTLSPASCFKGTITVPGDKSLSHRALLFGALAQGKTRVTGLLKSADVRATQACLEALGVRFEKQGDEIIIHGVGLQGFKKPDVALDCGNSGTTMRLMMGLLAGQDFEAVLTGDASLCKRPMKRIAGPLRNMGAEITLTDGDFAPVNIKGGRLQAVEYELPVASAQLKSALLIAALFADGETRLTGKILSRDHTERLLPAFGCPVAVRDDRVALYGGRVLKGTSVKIPGDISSAAFWMAGACLVEGAEIEMDNVSLNPTRRGFLDVLGRMGANIEEEVTTPLPEPLGQVKISYAPLKGTVIEADEVPRLIDEIPLIAVLGARAEGVTEIRGAKELRVKESDRLEAVAKNLRAMGAKIELREDGFKIEGPQTLHGADIETFSDHRIAMAFAIASLAANSPSRINDRDCVNISYPGFFDELASITGAGRV